MTGLNTASLAKKKRTVKEYIGIFLRGIAMGASDIVPGVSGGTIAFIFGIYEELIESIRKFGDPDFLQAAIRFRVKKIVALVNWEFLLALGLGILTAVFSLSHFLEWLLFNQPVYLWSFFFGLVVASILAVGKRISNWTSALWGMLAFGAIFAFLLVGLGILTAVFSLSHFLEWLLFNQPVYLWSFFFGLVVASILAVGKRISNWTSALWGMLAFGAIFAFLLVGLVPTHTPETWWFMILSGTAASVALILPGISGSFILLLMGKYQHVVGAVTDRDFFTLALIAAGAVIGLVTFAQLISRLFKKHHDLTVALLTGFMVGSLRKIWPWREAVNWLQDDVGNFILDSEGHRRIITEALRLPDFASPEGIAQFALALIFAVIGVGLIVLVDRIAKKNGQEKTKTAE